MIRRIFGYSSLDIQANNGRNDFVITIDNKRNLLSTIGAGFSEFLVVLSGLATSEAAFVFIDEPESHLHPALQTEFVAALKSYASSGVVFATHSIGLARTAAQRIYTVRRDGSHSTVREWAKTGRLSELIGESGSAPTRILDSRLSFSLKGQQKLSPFNIFSDYSKRNIEWFRFNSAGVR